MSLCKLAKHRLDRRTWQDRSGLVFGCSVDIGVLGAAAHHRAGEAIPRGNAEELGSARGGMGEC